MAAHAARRIFRMNRNLNTIIGVELMCAAQGIEFRAPLKTSGPLGRVMMEIRSVIPRLEDDRYLADDIAVAGSMVSKGTLPAALELGGYVLGELT